MSEKYPIKQRASKLGLLGLVLFVSILVKDAQGVFQTYNVSYQYGGDDWTDYPTCINGTQQSPVDIPLSIKKNSTSLNTKKLVKNDNLLLMIQDRNVVNATIEDLNITNEVEFDDQEGSMIFWNETGSNNIYQIVQMHMHAPSEHTFNGAHFDLELHMLHKSKIDGSLAMIAIYFDVLEGGNEQNPFIDSWEFDQHNPVVPLIPLQNLIRHVSKHSIYHYKGSDTAPPCDENIDWILLTKPQPISQDQMELINHHWKNNPLFAGGHGNNRNIQPLNNRYIYYKQTKAAVYKVAVLSLTIIFGLINLF